MGPKDEDRAPGTPPWREPVRGGYPPMWLLGLPPTERLAAWQRGLGPRPPLQHLTGARFTGFGDGTAEAAMPASEWLANSAGLIGGGTLAIVADIAFGVSVETKLPPATPYTTAELSLTYLAPARPGGALGAHGQAIHVGRSVGLSEVFVLDPSGEELLAHGTSRIAIMPSIEGLPDPPEDPQPRPRPDAPTPDPHLRPPPDGTVLPQEIWAEVDGLEVLRRQLAGELPAPGIHHLTGMTLTRVEEGRVTMTMPATEWLSSPARRLQGGTIAALADATLQGAMLTTTPAGTALAGIDLKVNFLRPVEGDGRDLTAEAEVEHRGRTLAIARGRVTNADGKPVMLATGTGMYLPARRADLSGEAELAGERATETS